MEKITNKKIEDILPHRPPFLFIDKVLSIKGSSITASRTIKKDEEFLKGHFPGNPIVPGVLVIESEAQAAGIIASHVLGGNEKRPSIFYLSRVVEMKFKAPVLPGDTIIIMAEVLGQFGNSVKVSTRAEVKGVVVAEGELVLSKK